jgi:hypothetical protein
MAYIEYNGNSVAGGFYEEDYPNVFACNGKCENCNQFEACEKFGGNLCNMEDSVQTYINMCYDNGWDIDMDVAMKIEYGNIEFEELEKGDNLFEASAQLVKSMLPI